MLGNCAGSGTGAGADLPKTGAASSPFNVIFCNSDSKHITFLLLYPQSNNFVFTITI